MKKLMVPPISQENERKALELLKRLCSEQLKQYPTNYEEDVKLLEDRKLTCNQRNCIVFRASEKKVQYRTYIMLDPGVSDRAGGSGPVAP